MSSIYLLFNWIWSGYRDLDRVWNSTFDWIGFRNVHFHWIGPFEHHGYCVVNLVENRYSMNVLTRPARRCVSSVRDTHLFLHRERLGYMNWYLYDLLHCEWVEKSLLLDRFFQPEELPIVNLPGYGTFLTTGYGWMTPTLIGTGIWLYKWMDFR